MKRPRKQISIYEDTHEQIKSLVGKELNHVQLRNMVSVVEEAVKLLGQKIESELKDK